MKINNRKPSSLYDAAIKRLSESLPTQEASLKNIHPTIKIDILKYLYINKKYFLLHHYFEEWLLTILSFGSGRTILHKIFATRWQMEPNLCAKMKKELKGYIDNCGKYPDGSWPCPDSIIPVNAYKSAKQALDLAVFFSDAGCYQSSSEILSLVKGFVDIISTLVDEKIVCEKGNPPSETVNFIQEVQGVPSIHTYLPFTKLRRRV